jgi:hypothetical protein
MKVNKQCNMSGLHGCHVKQRGNRTAIDCKSIHSSKNRSDCNRLGLLKVSSYNRDRYRN